MDAQYNLYRDVSKACAVDAEHGERAIRSIWEFIAKQMEEKELRAVRLPFFGLFWCKPYRVQKLIETGKLPAEAAQYIPSLRL